LAIRIAFADGNVTLGRSLESGLCLNFSTDVAGGISILLLLERVVLDDLFDHLTKSNTAFFAFQHLTVDGDFSIKHLLGVEESLEFSNQALAFLLHSTESSITFVQSLFVLSLIVVQLIVEILDFLLKLSILGFQVCQLATKV